MGRTPSSTDYRPRIKPPASLPEPVAVVFAKLVAGVSADHFAPTDLPLLTEYARAAVLADEAAAEMAKEGAVTDGKPSPWLRVQDQACKSLVALSARLRLCPQSRFDRLKAGTSTRQGFPDDVSNPDGLLAGVPRTKPKTGLASFR